MQAHNPIPDRSFGYLLRLLRCTLLFAYLVVGAEVAADTGTWQHGIGGGTRTSYAPATLPATVLDYHLSKPFGTSRYLYHRINVGLWNRQENRIPPGVIVVPVVGSSLPYYTTAYASYGIGLRSTGRTFVYFNHGVGLISETTPYLGTHGQFLTAMGLGYRGRNRTYECGVQHLSNGSRYFGTPGPNAGEDFFLCSVTIIFRKHSK